MCVMRKIIGSVLLSATCLSASAQADWRLKRDEDGIKVFTSDNDHSDFKCIKVECTVEATPTQLVALLLDIDRQHEWVYGSKSAQMVKKNSPNDFVFYSQVSVPWPCADRDYVAHITVNQPSPQLITIDSHSEPGLAPEKDRVVRVKKSSAHWDVVPVGSGLLKIIYTVSFDPAGSVPAWLTNMFVTKGPFQTFQKLRERVKGAYGDSHFDFIKD